MERLCHTPASRFGVSHVSKALHGRGGKSPLPLTQCLPWRGNLMQFGEFDYLRSLRLAGMIYECFSEIHFDTNTAKDI